jgi:hypothetical protein
VQSELSKTETELNRSVESVVEEPKKPDPAKSA